MNRRTFLATTAALAVTPLAFASAPFQVWQINASDWYLAPTLEEAIRHSMDLSGTCRAEVYSPEYGAAPVSEADLATMGPFYDEQGNERDGLDEYRELLAKGVRVTPFSAGE